MTPFVVSMLKFCGRSRRWLWLAAVGWLVTVAQAQPLEKVRLQLKWTHQFQFAGYYAALHQGYYREAGLDVELVEAQPGRDPTHEVLAGHAEYGVGNSDLLLLRHKGEPVVVLAAIFQHSPMVLLVRAASGVTDLQGLHDRELMMLASESAELFAYFKFEGIDPAKLRIRSHSLNIEDFVAGRVDGMSAYGTDEPWNLRQRGVPFLQFTPRAGGIDFYGDNLFTTEAEIARHPARVRAFREASLRGWDYALKHPEEMVDLILRLYPRKMTREHLRFEATQTGILMHPGLIEVGHMNPGRWRHMAETYAEFNMLPRDFSLAGFLYDPDPRPDYAWIYWALGAVSVVAVAALGWLLPLLRLNARLRAAKDAAEAADIAKTRYLAFLAHEIRTPLNGLVGLVSLLKDEALPPSSRELVDLQDRSAQSLLKLVDSVLDFSRLDAGRLTVERLSVSPAAFAEEVAELFRPAAQAKGITLRCSVRPDVPATVLTDPVRLRQIVANLLSNAVKFTERGGVEMDWSLAPEAPGGRRWLRCQVRDTGPGISAELQAKLFEPFTQADTRHGGSGLGLSISRQLARLLGGQITVQSEPGLGSAFTLTIDVGAMP